MAPTTCYGYKRRYYDVETLKKQIIIHGKNAGVIIADNNDGPVLSIDDFIKVSPKILSRKRPRIEEHSVPVVKIVTEVLMEQPTTRADGTEQPMAQPLVLNTEPVPMVQFEQPREETLVHTAEQPIEQEADAAPVQMLVQEADAAPVPLVQPEQPMAQAQVPMQEATIFLPSCTNTPIFNSANKPLVLNGLVIEVDPVTLMVNATQMCKAAGKFFVEYHRSKCYKDFQNELSEAMGIPISELTRCENGNRKGSMVHRRKKPAAHTNEVIIKNY
jgi:hypothetical protein